MKLLSVNVGGRQLIESGDSRRETGIFKIRVEGSVAVTREGLSGDAICDSKHHGGVDQAIYVYGEPDYDWWAENLACELAPGTFGENLTISDLYSSQACIGDRLLIGSTELEITAPRIPCGTLARRMNDSSFTKLFRAAERPGLYCRVLRVGYVQAGDPVRYERYSGDTITALELFRAFYIDHMDESTLRRHLAAPIAIRDRIEKERALAKLTRNVTS